MINMKSFRFIFSIFYYIVVISCATIIHVAIIQLLPFPFNQINSILLVVVGLLILTVDIQNLWVSVFFGFLLELLSTIPFGITIAAFVISMTLVYWILTNIFTHRSIYIVFFMGGKGIFTYRAIITTLLVLNNFFHPGTYLLDLGVVGVNLGIEIILTTTALATLYALSHLFVKKLKPEYVIRERKLL